MSHSLSLRAIRRWIQTPWAPMVATITLLISVASIMALVLMVNRAWNDFTHFLDGNVTKKAVYQNINSDFVHLRDLRADGWDDLGKAGQSLLIDDLLADAQQAQRTDAQGAQVYRATQAYAQSLRDEQITTQSIETYEDALATALLDRHTQLDVEIDEEMVTQRQQISMMRTLRTVGISSACAMALMAILVMHRHRRAFTEQSEAHKYASRHDALTGLPNRLALTEALAQMDEHSNSALLLMDLDRFKEINDTLGHHYGDQLLIGVADRLRVHVRAQDLAVRMGGDEFAIVLHDVDADQALSIARRIHKALTVPLTVDGAPLSVEASIGVATFEQAKKSDLLLRQADAAMYAAKSARREVLAWNRQMNTIAPEQLSLVAELRGAIAEGQLILHYQPKVDPITQEVVGVEALVRWNHPERGIVPPDQFIPFAESTALIHPLTYFVLDTAIAQAASWWQAGRTLPVSVNLSGRSLVDHQIVLTVLELLGKHGCPAYLLELEITESALMEEAQLAKQVLEHLHAVGVTLSLDDFGAGYTSLAQLRELPLDVVKIDRSLVTQAGEVEVCTKILTSLIDLSHVLGLKVVAEGVEDLQTADLLSKARCHSVQGFYYSRPLPVAELEEWVHQRQVLQVG